MGDSFLLTQAERDRFATYLEQEAQTDEGMAEQMSKFGHEPMAQKYRVEGMAARVIAKKLRETESMMISADEQETG